MKAKNTQSKIITPKHPARKMGQQTSRNTPGCQQLAKELPYIHHIAISKNGQYLAVTADSKVLSIWDLTPDPPVRIHVQIRRNNEMNFIAFNPTNDRQLAYTDVKSVRIIDVVDGREINRFEIASDRQFDREPDLPPDFIAPGKTATMDIVFFNDGRHLAVSTLDGRVHIINTVDGREIRQWDICRWDGRMRAYRLEISPDNKKLVTNRWGEPDQVDTRIWNIDDGTELRRLDNHGIVSEVRFTSDSLFLATCSLDNPENNESLIRLWDVNTGAILRQFHLDEKIRDIGFSPDGRWLALAGVRGKIYIYNIDTLTPIQEWKGHKKIISGMVFMPNGNSLITASYDKSIKIWKVKQGLVKSATKRV